MAPELRFRGQPFSDEDTVGAFLTETLCDRGISRLTIVVAWARFGGLRRCQASIASFRKRGGRFRVILGIDEGIATVPGLTLACESADEAFVFHDPGARTFHPKLYLAEGAEKARLLVGSSNLTAGGLYSNYEAALQADFALPAEQEDAAFARARSYVEKLLEDKELCLPLDRPLLERLVDNPRYAIANREGRAQGNRPNGLGEEDVDQRGETAEEGEAIFGKTRHRKATVPGLPKKAAVELKQIEPRTPRPPAQRAAAASWTKVLSPSDAQHPPSAGSNPLGNVRLTQAKHAIDWLTWFRHELFGSADWRKVRDRKGNEIEIAWVPFAVTIDGNSHGVVELQVDHAVHRESGQHNHATVLHWGRLGSLLRKTDYTGFVLALQRMSDGSYHLDISP